MRNRTNLINVKDLSNYLNSDNVDLLFSRRSDNYKLNILTHKDDAYKSVNCKLDILREWRIMEFLKKSKIDSKLINQSELIEINGKYMIRMPKMINFSDFMKLKKLKYNNIGEDSDSEEEDEEEDEEESEEDEKMIIDEVAEATLIKISKSLRLSKDKTLKKLNNTIIDYLNRDCDESGENEQESENDEIGDSKQSNINCDKYVIDVLNQLLQLHKIGIIHFDIKEDNMYYDKESDRLVLADYGLSQKLNLLLDDKEREMDFLDKNRTFTTDSDITTEYYRAPESLYQYMLTEYYDYDDMINLKKKELEIAENNSEREMKDIININNKIDKFISRKNNIFKLSYSLSDEFIENDDNICTLHKSIYSESFSLAQTLLAVFGDYVSDDIKAKLEKLADPSLDKRLYISDVM